MKTHRLVECLFLALLCVAVWVDASLVRPLSGRLARLLMATNAGRPLNPLCPWTRRIDESRFPMLGDMDERTFVTVPANTIPLVEDNTTRRYKSIQTIFFRNHYALYAAQDKQTLNLVTLNCVRYLFLQDPRGKLRDFDRIQEATRHVRAFEEQGSCWSDVPNRHALPEHRDHFAVPFTLGTLVYTVLEPLNLQTIHQFIHLIRSYNLEVRERLVARVIRSLLGAVRHIHRAGYLHGDLQAENVLIELVDGLPRVRLFNFRAVPIKNLSTDLKGEQLNVRKVAAYITSRGRNDFETVSAGLESLQWEALSISSTFEALESHPFLKS